MKIQRTVSLVVILFMVVSFCLFSPAQEFDEVIQIFNGAIAEGDYSQAENQAFRLYSLSEDNPILHRSALFNLLRLYVLLDDAEKSQEIRDKLVALDKKLIETCHPDFSDRWFNQLRALKIQGKKEACDKLFMKELSRRMEIYGSNSLAVAYLLNQMAQHYLEEGDLDQSESYFLWSLSIDEELLGLNKSTFVTNWEVLATHYEKTEQMTKLRKLYERIIDCIEMKLSVAHPQLKEPLLAYAHLLAKEGNFHRARSMYFRTLGIYESLYGPKNRRVAELLEKMVPFFREICDMTKADELQNRADAIRSGEIAKYVPFYETPKPRVSDVILPQFKGITRSKETRGLIFQFNLPQQSKTIFARLDEEVMGWRLVHFKRGVLTLAQGEKRVTIDTRRS